MTIDLNKVTKAYLRLRDARDELRRDYTEADNKLKEKQERLEAEMLSFLNDTKQESSRTISGTPTRLNRDVQHPADLTFSVPPSHYIEVQEY